MHDGADEQARAVLPFLQDYAQVECSWNNKKQAYDAEIQIARWENCREQGYIVYLVHLPTTRQMNIAFFEHRNSDCICAVQWEQWAMNSITIETARFPQDIYKDEYGCVSHTVNYGEVLAMAKWISKELEAFWKACEA